MTVDFTNIPDSTPVAAGNLYGGVLYLEAMTGSRWLPGVVSAGSLAVQPEQTPGPEHESHLTGVFLQPVTDVALVVRCLRNATCYQGLDAQGVGFNTMGQVIPGNIDPASWVTVQLTVPNGGRLVSF